MRRFVIALLLCNCGGAQARVAALPSPRPVDAPSRPPKAPTAHSTKCLDLATCRVACDEGATAACRSVGAMVYDEKTEPAAPYFERACPVGNPVAKGADAEGCYRLALLLDSGRTIAPDRPRAISLWTAACELGHAQSCYVLAHQIPKNGPADGAKTKALFIRACDLHVSLCAAAAEAVDAGSTGAPDEALARSLLRKACDAELYEECKSLRDMDDRVAPRETAFYREIIISHDKAIVPLSMRPRAEARARAEAAARELNGGADFYRIASTYDDSRRRQLERRSVRLSLINTAEHTTRRPQPEFLVKPGQATFFADAGGYHVIYRLK